MNTMRPSRFGAPLMCALILMLSSLPASAVLTPNGKLQIVHLNVGQGDGAVIMSPLGQLVMIDDGTDQPGRNCYNKSYLALTALGVTHVDYRFASHYHSDHLGCFQTVDSLVHYDQGWDRGSSYTSGQYTKYATQLGGRRHTMTKGRVWTLDSLSAHPVTIRCIDFTTSNSDENSNSVLLRVDYGNFSESFGGDLQGTSAGSGVDFESAYSLELDTVMVYKVHHHGSKHSSYPNWLARTAPKAAVIPTGPNTYPHPTQSALTRLHNAGVKTYWTDRGATSGVDFATPDPLWDKISYGHVYITAKWAGGDTTWIRGGTGGGAFSDFYINPGAAPVVGVDERVTVARPLRLLRNPVTTSAQFAVGVTGSPMSELRIFTVDGRQVRTVFTGVLAQGEQLLTWDGRDASGQRVDSGVYFARFTSRGRAESVKLLVLR
jgi:beta-lactamase superfamily II metal-dependent hydrolase